MLRLLTARRHAALCALLLAAASMSPARAQSPDAPGPEAWADSVATALRAGAPSTPADTARLRRWADSLRAAASSMRSANPARAASLLTSGLGAARALGDSSRVARFVGGLGVTDFYRSRYDAAARRFQKAHRKHQRLGNTDRAIASLNNLGAVRRNQGRYDDALEAYRTVLSQSREAGNQEGMTSALTNMGIIFVERGQYERALDNYRTSLSIEREEGDRDAVATDLNNIGIVLEKQGRYREAIARYREALRVNRRRGDRASMASNYNNIGNLHRREGQLDRALRAYRNALEINRAQGDRDGVATNLNNIGLIHATRGELDRGREAFARALAIHRKIGNRSDVALTQANIGDLHEKEGQYDRALNRYREALQTHRDLEARADVAAVQTSIADIYRQQDRYDEALRRARNAHRTYRRLGMPPASARCLKVIGAVYLDRGRPAVAADTLRRAVDAIEGLRDRATSPEARRSLLATEIAAHRTLTTAYVRADRPRAALRSIESTRARLLVERLSAPAAADSAGRPASMRAPLPADSLRGVLDPGEAALLYGNVDAARPAVAVVVRPDTVAARELPERSVRAGLGDDEAERFDRLRAQTGPFRSALRGSPPPEATGPDPTLAQSVRYYRALLTRPVEPTRSGQVAPAPIEDSLRNALAQALYDWLVRPVRPLFASSQTLVVVPSGTLGYLPLETLRSPQGRYLVEEVDVRYAPSLSVLQTLQQRRRPAPRRSVLAFGGALYPGNRGTQPAADDNRPVVLATARGDTALVSTREHTRLLLDRASRQLERGESPRGVYAQLGHGSWPDLPGSRVEAERVTRIAGPGARLERGRYASEARLRRLSRTGKLDDYRRVHFATHGVAVPEAPNLSALVLSQVGASDSLAASDGYLTAPEIARLDLAADVTVLSACQTGLGQIVAGEGIVGLTHAFLRAGSNATLVSGWTVVDASTRRFMEAVYRQARRDDLTFAAAVSAVKRDFIAGRYGKANTSPLRWAPFVYYGLESTTPD
jgi:CHAT domain-containing protein/tetratricopeptide (TPR) repeat protein